MPDYLISIALQKLAIALPLFIVWIVGIAIAIIQWDKSPRNSIFSIIAFILLPLSLISELTWNVYGIHWLQTSRTAMPFARPLLIIIPLLLYLLRTAAFVLVLFALFGKSKVKASSNEANAEVMES